MEDQDGGVLEAAEALILCSLSNPAVANEMRSSDPRQSSRASFERVPCFLPLWGIRSKRSRYSGDWKRESEEDDSSAARPSPATPLDLAATSQTATSGSEGSLPSASEIHPSKRQRTAEPSAMPSASLGDVYQKIGATIRCSRIGTAITSSSSRIRRHGKKSVNELQAQESSLLEENAELRTLLESKRKEMEALITEKKWLIAKKSNLQLLQAEDEAQKRKFLLPDLNEPAIET